MAQHCKKQWWPNEHGNIQIAKYFSLLCSKITIQFTRKSHPHLIPELGLHPDPKPDLGLKIQIFENWMKFMGEFEVFLK